MKWEAVMRVLAALEEAQVDYVVIGGVAVNFHGIVRATEDLDVFVKPDADNVARLRAALHSVYDDPSIDEITAADLCGEYPAVRYVPPGDGPPMDILTRLGERFRFADKMKHSTVRPLDHADAARLAEAFDLGEESQ